MEGAGRVRVLIYTGESEEMILAREGAEENSDTTETDASGGNRHIQAVSYTHLTLPTIRLV